MCVGHVDRNTSFEGPFKNRSEEIIPNIGRNEPFHVPYKNRTEEIIPNIERNEPFHATYKNRSKEIIPNIEIINENGKVYHEDILALSTYYIQVLLLKLKEFTKDFQDSIYYKILFHTTQPAHVITAISVIMISLMMMPSENRSSLHSPLWSLIYIGSFSAHFGAQLWMTFVSGLALYFALPRHIFGNIQKVLFPKYFLLNSILSLITLYVFLRAHKHELYTMEIFAQVGVMTLCFLIELVIRLYLTPPLLSLISIKNRIEGQAGVGMEVGKLVPGNLLNCPHYVTVHKAFRKVHMTIAIGNIITMACTTYHLNYLSQRLCFL